MIDNRQVHKPDDTPILFINFRDEQFIGYWDKKPYHFAPKEQKWLPLWLALHFSKHIVDDEMNARKLPTDHSSRESFVAKCIGNKPGQKEDNSDPLGIEILNKNMNAEKEKKTEPKKPGRPKKEAEKQPSSEIDEFEGK